MKFCSLVLELHLPQNFCHTHTDRQTFSETDKSCSEYPKTYNSVKNRKSEICTKPILSSVYIEDNRRKIENTRISPFFSL